MSWWWPFGSDSTADCNSHHFDEYTPVDPSRVIHQDERDSLFELRDVFCERYHVDNGVWHDTKMERFGTQHRDTRLVASVYRKTKATCEHEGCTVVDSDWAYIGDTVVAESLNVGNAPSSNQFLDETGETA